MEGDTRRTKEGAHIISRNGKWLQYAGNDAEAAQLEALKQGRMTIPSGYALTKAPWPQLLSKLAVYAPKFDASKGPTRTAEEKATTSGRQGDNATSINSAINHLGQLAQISRRMGGTFSPDVNHMINMFKEHTGDEDLKQFRITRNHASEELTRAFRGAAGTEADVTRNHADISEDDPPHTREAGIRTEAHLLDGRINALQFQQARGTGAAPFTDMLSPAARAALEGLKSEGMDHATGGAPVAPSRGGKTPGAMSNDELMSALGGH